ncbi:MAG: SGNH/GDSL hydrolase family protein, partial [Planctomycetota bacterium]
MKMLQRLRLLALLWIGLIGTNAVSQNAAYGEHEGRVQVLLLGDSTTIGSVCRQTNPDGPHLEDVIRLKLATNPDLPPTNVINQGRDGEFIHGLLESGRYEKEISKLPGIDFVFIRYGLNDRARRDNFPQNFPLDFQRLITRLRQDFPTA